jgi:DMSO/TMAO reductase YedYZ molybdopterin-dependent catalytic subunit
VKRKLEIPRVDSKLLVRDATKLMSELTRRRLLASGGGLGALLLLTGCDVVNEDAAEDVLRKISKLNDAIQSYIFNPSLLAPTYPESAITRPFPYNAYYGVEDAPDLDGASYRFEISGLVDGKKTWTVADLHSLPETTQITRHVCVEGWSAIGSWSGIPLRDFLKMVGADTRAKYCYFRCAEGYANSIDMPTALHPQTLMAFKCDRQVLTRAYGFPMKIRIPTKLGFKNPKYVVSMEVTNDYKGGYWEDQGYNSFSGS